MATPFPHHYAALVTRTAAARSRVRAALRAPIHGGPPPEFGGDELSWSPEHLLLSAIGLCVETTFEALAAREQLEVGGFEARVEGVLDKTRAGLAFTSFIVEVDLTVAAQDTARAKEILERAHHHCIISNALKTEVALIARVTSLAA